MNIQQFEEKIKCAINQAKVRNIKITNDSWHTRRKQNGLFEFDDSGRVYIIAFFIEGRRWRMLNGGGSFYEWQVAERVLGISEPEISAFNNGFCGSSDMNGLKDYYNLGVKYGKILGLL